MCQLMFSLWPKCHISLNCFSFFLFEIFFSFYSFFFCLCAFFFLHISFFFCIYLLSSFFVCLLFTLFSLHFFFTFCIDLFETFSSFSSSFILSFPEQCLLHFFFLWLTSFSHSLSKCAFIYISLLDNTNLDINFYSWKTK